MVQMTGGEAVVQALRHEGVDTVFGMPGVQIMNIYDAFHGQSDTRLLTVRHEQTAAYMADGYARVTGKPGVALVVPGPGVQNASAALGTAYSGSSPVLLLAGQVESYNVGQDRGALHEINDQQDIIRPVTKWSGRANSVAEIAPAIQEAMRQMRTGRPRPTEMEVAPDILAMRGEVDFAPPAAPDPQAPDWTHIRQAADLLRGAKKPLIWAGGGVILADAARELTALAESLGAPVATTNEGKGAIPEDHRLALGTGYYGHGASSWAVPKADVILAVGIRMTAQMTGLNAPREPQKLIHLDADGDVIGRNYPAEVSVVADARLGLQALLEEVRREAPAPQWRDDELDDIRRLQSQWLEAQAPDQCEMIRRMQDVLPEETVLVSGVTNMGYWSYFAYHVHQPRTYITSSYFATLGYSFPLALGGQGRGTRSAGGVAHRRWRIYVRLARAGHGGAVRH